MLPGCTGSCRLDAGSAAEDNPDEIPDLVAEILTRAVERRLRRNLSSEFDQRKADLTRVRGRIDVLRTERRHLLQRGRIACSFDELTTDTPKNRYVRAALNHLHQMVRENELKRRCRITCNRTGEGGSWLRRIPATAAGTSAAGLRCSAGRTEHRGSSDAGCGRADVQPEASHGGSWSVTIPSAGPGRAMGQVVVRGGGGRLLQHCALTPGWSVRTGSKLNWQIESPTAGIELLLPGMTTDIILERQAGAGMPTRSRLVIDTKFTSMVETGQYGNPTLRSGYIYQIYAYLRSQERKTDPLSLTASVSMAEACWATGAE